jgi:hypothetical protein
MLRVAWRSFWGMLIRPRATVDTLAGQPSIRPAVLLVLSVLLLGWLNLLLFVAFGYDWLGTRRELVDPTYIGFFGQLRVGLAGYVPVFHLLVAPLLALLGLVVLPGLAQVLSKLWRGQGTFEQMVNTMVYAQAPSILIRSVINDMLLGGIPANLLAGHRYAFTAAMSGEFGSAVSTLWWIYMTGIYISAVDLWVVALGTIAIRRVQRVPWWAAASIMLLSYVLWFYGLTGSVVR